MVVGASGGLGRAVAVELLRGGADVALTHHAGAGSLEPILEEAGGLGRRAFARQMDVRCRSSVVRACASIIEHVGVPDYLVYAAGVVRDRPLVEMSEADWTDVVDVNMTGNHRVIRAVAREMMRKRKGRIVSISSVSGMVGVEGQTNYAASKGGVMAFTRALSRELGPFGVMVNTIAPGLMETAMTTAVSDVARRRILSRIPVRRIGVTADILPALRFLLDPENTYVTGQTIVVDGGLTA